MSDYTVKHREDAPDVLGDYPGEMRFLADTLGCEQVAVTWRLVKPGTGGRGSYGHRHKTQEEVYMVTSGTLTFKVGDDVFEAPRGTAVRVPPESVRSLHNDSDEDAELVITSVQAEDLGDETETVPDFWP